jgi:hypothetical protein
VPDQLNPLPVTAVIPTRGDVDLAPVLDRIDRVADEVVIATGPLGTYERYLAMERAKNPVIFTQDDDVLVPRRAELVEHFDGRMLCNMDPAWIERGPYHACGLNGMGGMLYRESWKPAVYKYLRRYPEDRLFYDWCDIVVGVLTPFKVVDLGYSPREAAEWPNRLSRVNGNREAKHMMIARCLELRDE